MQLPPRAVVCICLGTLQDRGHMLSANAHQRRGHDTKQYYSCTEIHGLAKSVVIQHRRSQHAQQPCVCMYKLETTKSQWL